MRISVFGCGYLGAVHAVCMTKLGHDVVGIDISESQVRALSQGDPPFFEPGLADLLKESLDSGRLRFSTEAAEASGAEVHFICVATPQKKGENAADLHYVDAVVGDLLPYLSPGDVVVGKSTVPVGTAERLAERITKTAPDVALVWNPEFLREGHAVADTISPDRFVYGVSADHAGSAAAAKLDQVYAAALGEGTPKIVTDLATA